MLVISRKRNQSVQFPDVGISVQILEPSKSKVLVGIEAPPEVRIVREEIVGDQTREELEERIFRIPGILRHEIRNELNLISLSLHVFKRKAERGLGSTDELFEELVQRIERVAQHDSIASPSGTTKIYSDKHRVSALIVEDSDNERELLGGFLELHGFHTHSVCSAEAATEFLEENDPPDAILLDMQLPKSHGSDLLRLVRESARFDDTSVIVISGTTPEENNLSEEDGLDAWFNKPIDPRKLVVALQQIPHVNYQAAQGC